MENFPQKRSINSTKVSNNVLQRFALGRIKIANILDSSLIESHLQI